MSPTTFDEYDDADENADDGGEGVLIYPRPGELGKLRALAASAGLRLAAPIPKILVARGYAAQPWFQRLALDVPGTRWANELLNGPPQLWLPETGDPFDSLFVDLGLDWFKSPVLGGDFVDRRAGSIVRQAIVSPRAPYWVMHGGKGGLYVAPRWVKAIERRPLEERIHFAERVAALSDDATKRAALHVLLHVTSGKTLIAAIEDLDRQVL